MVDNEWISTLNALRQANKEKDEFIASLMDDLANSQKAVRDLERAMSHIYSTFDFRLRSGFDKKGE